MGRYVGLTNNRGKGGGGLGPVKPYTRSTGISTNSLNNVTAVALDDVEYTAMQYDSVGLVTDITKILVVVRKVGFVHIRHKD